MVDIYGDRVARAYEDGVQGVAKWMVYILEGSYVDGDGSRKSERCEQTPPAIPRTPQPTY